MASPAVLDTVAAMITVHGHPGPAPVSLLTVLEAQAGNRTGGIVTGRRHHSWADVWSLAGTARNTIVGRCGTGGAIGMLLRNTVDAVACFAGGLRAGANVVSLPHPGRAVRLDEYVTSLAAICTQTGVTAVVADADVAGTLAGRLCVPVVTFEEVCRTLSPTAADAAGTLTQFTSGSTGTPKGVPLDTWHLGANVQAIIEHAEFDRSCDFVSWLPLSHDMGLVGMLLCSWAAGSTLTLRAPDEFVFDPAVWLNDVAAAAARVTAVPNFALDMAARAVERGRHPGPLGGLEQLIVGGEPNIASSFRRFEHACSPFGLRPNALTPAYGMAEAALAVTMTARRERWRSVTVDTDALATGRIAGAATGVELVVCGTPLPGFRVTAGEALGATQRVRIDGPSVTAGYVESPARTGDLVTADVGYIGGGELVIVGRADDVIVVRGVNIWPGDVERAVGQCPHARPGCVAAIPVGGELVVVAEPAGASQQLDAVARELRRLVTSSVGIGPRRVVWVEPGSIPKTSSGKLQRKAIAGRLAGAQLAVIADIDWRPAR